MEIYVPDDELQRSTMAKSVEDLDYFVVPNRQDEFLEFDYWLGASQDGSTWVLFKTASRLLDDADFKVTVDHLVCGLTNPPKRNRQIIGQILFQVQKELSKSKDISIATLQRIIYENPFPDYPRVSDLLFPIVPDDWQELRAEFEVSFRLSEGAAISREAFKEYRRHSLESVMATVFSPRIPGLLLIYSCKVREAIPLSPFEVDWPLARKGTQKPYKRSKVTRDTPWSKEADTSLFSVYQSAPSVGFGGTPSYYANHSVRLKAAGRTAEDAVANWHTLARSLRKLKLLICQNNAR